MKNLIHRREQRKVVGDKNAIIVRQFEHSDNPEVLRIFQDGLHEMIPDTAFRALKYHPESMSLYVIMTLVCLIATKSWCLTALVPIAVLCARYYYSRQIALGYLEIAKRTDMGDIEGCYMNTPDCCLWVAVQGDRVIGVVAAVSHLSGDGAVELKRMAVDRSCRRRGVGELLGQKVLEFASARGNPSVVLGTTSYSPAAHKLYQKLGFRCNGVTNGYTVPGARRLVLEWVFYWVRHHHYHLDMPKAKTNTHGQH
ncbi:N-acetylaspartate synthetase-like [Osmerus mordax]|uniref:N-acetylaspartate synthetase-like n=1 Tax=Osmerus mordax TaxID=8014 RepID=UPI00350FEFE4